MRQSNAPPTARSEGDAPHVEDLTRSPAGRQGARAAAPPEPKASSRPSEWTAGRIAALAIGALLVLVSLALLGTGGTGLWADLTQRDAGYVTTDVHEFSTSGSALATEPTKLGSAGVGWLYSPGLLGEGSDPRHARELRPAAVRGHRSLGRRRSLPRRGGPHAHFRLLRGQGGGHRRRRAPIRSRNAALLGRLRRPAPEPEPWCGTRRRGRGRLW